MSKELIEKPVSGSNEAELLELKKQLSKMLLEVEAKLGAMTEPNGSKMNTDRLFETTYVQKAKGSRTVRALVLDILHELAWPAYSREIASFGKAWADKNLKSERFGTLSKDEFEAFTQGRTRPVWLCHALTYDRHQAIKRLWARSDWPLETRIIGPMTGRVQHLKITIRLCEIASRAEGFSADPEMMRIIAADHARDLPGINFKRGRFDFDLWKDAASRQLAELEPADEEVRRESAEQLKKYPAVFQLFGVPESIDGDGVRLRAAK